MSKRSRQYRDARARKRWQPDPPEADEPRRWPRLRERLADGGKVSLPAVERVK